LQTRDIVVLGSSLGGVEALASLAGSLPASFPAALLVVQHTAEQSPGLLADILDRRGALDAVQAEDGMPVERGRILVAPPGRHLLLTGNGVRVAYGPRENRVRPAVDPLFRSAAVHYRSRVVGVILTGTQGDGAAGLAAVHRCGGVAVVQDPADASAPEMPSSALAAVPDARTATLADLPGVLTALVGEPAPEPPPVPEWLRIEAELSERAMTDQDWERLPGRATDFTCPQCNGSLRQVEDDGLPRFRCRVGHAYSADALVGAKDASLEDALWLALQTLQERGQMLDRLAREEQVGGRSRSAAGYAERARETQTHVERLRHLIQKLSP